MGLCKQEVRETGNQPTSTSDPLDYRETTTICMEFQLCRRAPALMELENMKVDLTEGSNDGEDRNPEYCKICKLVFTSQTVAVSHYAGKNHAKAK